jgi:D-alanyl-D-alanine carboxypeptidase/D-alanyl-D-alanine-endopeptidase (penicillin-binding protein 4)
MICLALLAPRWAQADTDLAAKIDEVIKGPNYRQARWGVLVVDAETSKTVYELNPDQLFIPASTTKLYSCAAALAAFGPDYCFETPVYQRGNVADRRLQGDLILVAKGDLTFGGRNANGKMAFKNHDHIYANFLPGAELTDTDPLAGLKALAKQVAKAGIRDVAGEILVDDRFFPKNRGTGSGPDLLTPIVINDNVVDIVATPAAEAGKPAQLQIRPETRFLQIDAQIDTVAAGQSPKVDVRHGGPQRFVVRGRIPLKSKPLVVICPVDDPSALARALFIEALQKEGVTCSASPLQPPQAELPEKTVYDIKMTRVAVFKSLPFSEVIKVTLKVSHNLYASTLPILIATQKGHGTVTEGLHWQRKFLADLGVPTDTISFGGGAGGANADYVTPRATVQLLQAMAKRPDYAVFSAGLPVMGIDGTLAEAVAADSPARGKVRAKTGTLMWHDVMNNRTLLTSKALAGTLTTAKGRDLVVAMFVNGVPLPRGVSTTREGKVLGHLCEILVQHGP